MRKDEYALVVGLLTAAAALMIWALGSFEHAAMFMGGVSFAVSADLGKSHFVDGRAD